MALVLTVRAQALIAVLAAGTFVAGLATVAQRTDDDAAHRSNAGPSVGPQPSSPSADSPHPTASVTPSPQPTATPSAQPGGLGSGGSDSGSGGSGDSGSDSGGSGSGGGPMPGYKPKDGWPDIHGVVTDSSGKPLAGLYVTVERNQPDSWFRESGTVTDSRGRFRLRCEIDSGADVPWSAVFISAFPASRKVPVGLPDGAWKRIAPDCGRADDPGVHVVLAHGADVAGTLLKPDGSPDIGTRRRIGVDCDGLPHGFIAGWAPQLSFAVDPNTARFRVYGLITDHCSLGVIEPDGTRTQLTDKIALTEGTTVNRDLREKA